MSQLSCCSVSFLKFDGLSKQLQSLQTGDIVLFSGKGHVSSIIRIFTRSRWSHIGVVVRSGAQVFLWEATTFSTTPDYTVGEPLRGVTLVPLDQRIKDYNGHVAIRRLQGIDRDEALQHSILDLLVQWHCRPYKSYVAELSLDFFSLFRRRQTVDKLFCSELVAEVYKRAGWLEHQRKSSHYVPGHFSDDYKGLVLKRGFLSSEEIIKTPLAA